MASDIFGVSGRQMMAALIAGQRDPKILAQMARTAMRAKIRDLEEAFVGRFSEHHAFLLARMLAHIDALNADIAAVEDRIEQLVALSPGRWRSWMTFPVSVPSRPGPSSPRSGWT